MAFSGDVVAYADQGLGSEDQMSAAQNNFIVQNKFLKFILVQGVNGRNGAAMANLGTKTS